MQSLSNIVLALCLRLYYLARVKRSTFFYWRVLYDKIKMWHKGYYILKYNSFRRNSRFCSENSRSSDWLPAFANFENINWQPRHLTFGFGGERCPVSRPCEQIQGDVFSSLSSMFCWGRVFKARNVVFLAHTCNGCALIQLFPWLPKSFY